MQKLISCKWIFKKKIEFDGINKVRFKARLVARGFSQQEGIDFNEIFSPVVKHTSIRMLLAIVAYNNWELQQLDVKTAFLHGELEERILMSQPEGFTVPGSEGKVCRLKKSLYGLKQSSRQWYKRFDDHMIKSGFRRSLYDSCVYIKERDGKAVAYLLLYVDDMLIAGADKEVIADIKADLRRDFEMKELGDARRILGMDITRDRVKGELRLQQTEYVKKLLKKFQIESAKDVNVPFAQHFKLSMEQCPENDEERTEMSRIPYSNIVGSIMYSMICSRPDVAHSVSVSSRFMSNYGRQHWIALKWILRYLKGSTNWGILYKKSDFDKENFLIGYCDSDYAANRDNRKSQSGYLFTLFGSAISWKSNLQSVVALSTTEAEYIALAEAVKESMWLRGILTDFGLEQKCVTVLCDSNSAICLAKHQMYHERSKHIDVRLHFVRDEIEKGVVKVSKVSTEENAADMLTKALPASKFKHCLKLVNMVEF